MRLILESHSHVFCFDEMKAYSVLQTYSEESSGAFAGLGENVGFKIPRWTEQFCDPQFRDEGQPEICRNFYRGEKILFLIRDVRDVVVSMKKLKVGSAGTWLEFWPPRILLCKLARGSRFLDRYRRELAIMGRSEDALAAIGALYWTYKTSAILDYVEAGLPVLPVFYEDLVQEPRRILTDVCTHLGIEWDERLLAHQELDHPELFASGMTLGKTDPKASINTRSIGQWQSVLQPRELDVIDQIAGPAVEAMAGLRQRTQSA